MHFQMPHALHNYVMCGCSTGPDDKPGASQAPIPHWLPNHTSSAASFLSRLPQARNISITVRTIILGLGWLATFIFAANSVGLAGEMRDALQQRLGCAMS